MVTHARLYTGAYMHTHTHTGSLLSQRYMLTLHPQLPICIWPPCQIPSVKGLTNMPTSPNYLINERIHSDMDWCACVQPGFLL